MARGLRGIFINFVGQDRPYFFSRLKRAAAPRIDGELSFLPKIGWREAVHHCNGLLLVQDWEKLYVCNPATQRWAWLPPRPEGVGWDAHLVFDPTASLHYDVISFSRVPRMPRIPIQPDIKGSYGYRGSRVYYPDEIKNLPKSVRAKYDDEGAAEWPPSLYAAHVFSSRTGKWEERVYAREDDVAVTLSDVWLDPWGLHSRSSYQTPRCNAVCWRGAFYLHCRGGFIMRLSLQEHKYQVIKTPKLDDVFTKPRLDFDDFVRKEGPLRNKEICLRLLFEMERERLDREKPAVHIGKSKHGIYYTALCRHQLRVWVLNEAESGPMPEWELKHKADITPSFLQHFLREDKEEIETSWSLDCGMEESDDRMDYCGCDSSDDGVTNLEGKDEWDSSDDGVTNVKGKDDVDSGDTYCGMMPDMDLLGYHPTKEIAFLGNGFEGFAYYLSTSKLQYLGTFYPIGCTHIMVAATHESFIYTPCTDDLLPDHKRNKIHDGDLEEEIDTSGDDDQQDELHTNNDEDLKVD
ncbi:unnamed protein product [Urochloa decumbens]|uniref:F-box protein n=1 Tax=Urochloa decumbens TaxID=240449 RepID=A0ABC9GCZ4_9POAL